MSDTTSKEYYYSEIFDSIQGEGQYTGVPTAWLRFFLCNLQCNGFGQEDPTNPDTYILPYEDFDTSRIKTVEELPVWEYGCDSSYSWSKKYKHLQHKATPAVIAQRIRDEFTNEFNGGKWQDRHMCFTGGEPLMKHAQECVVAIMRHWIAEGDYPKSVTFETNGTQPLTDEFIEFFKEYDGELFFSVSPKLWTVAGEKAKRAILPEVIAQYNDSFSILDSNVFSYGQLKFVVGPKEEQWEEMEQVIALLREQRVDWPIWIMPVGATVEGQKLVDGDVAKMAYQRGYNVSARVHTYLWGNVVGV
jgi:7-carboxy-7-deazaguanine synthase